MTVSYPSSSPQRLNFSLIEVVEIRLKNHSSNPYMIQRIFRGDPISRIIRQHLRKEVQGLSIKIRRHLPQTVLSPSREGLFVVGEVHEIGPGGLSGGSQDLEDLEDLVDLGIADEKRALVRHFVEDGASGPDVDWG